MKILGIETATPLCATALADGVRVLSEEAVEAPQVHAERLLALIDVVLKENNVPPSELHAIAVSIGPGSYTGLRIGLSVAKGLAYSLEKPIVAVPTLQAMALHAIRTAETTGRTIVPMLDSRRDEVFIACYRSGEGIPVETSAPAAMATTDAAALIRSAGQTIIIGPGAQRMKPLLAGEIASGQVMLMPEELPVCSAAAVALLGAQLHARHGAADTASLEPFYLKEFFTTAKPVQTTE